MTPARSAPAAFAVRVPESWIEFDVWRATRTGDLARLVDTRIAQEPQLRSKRGALLKLLRAVAQDAERNGVRFCAAMAEMDEDSGMLAATVMVFHSPGSPDPAENTVEAIAAQLSAVAAGNGHGPNRRVELVDVPAGRAVRVSGVEAADVGAGTPVDCVIMQTLLPLPGGSGVLNAVLSSPQMQLAEPMLDLFEAISDTFDLYSDPDDEAPEHH